MPSIHAIAEKTLQALGPVLPKRLMWSACAMGYSPAQAQYSDFLVYCQTRSLPPLINRELSNIFFLLEDALSYPALVNSVSAVLTHWLIVDPSKVLRATALCSPKMLVRLVDVATAFHPQWDTDAQKQVCTKLFRRLFEKLTVLPDFDMKTPDYSLYCASAWIHMSASEYLPALAQLLGYLTPVPSVEAVKTLEFLTHHLGPLYEALPADEKQRCGGAFEWIQAYIRQAKLMDGVGVKASEPAVPCM